MEITSDLKKKIEDLTGEKIVFIKSLSGGCISNASRVETISGRNYFLKFKDFPSTDMFLKEANGLKELAKASALRVPNVILAEESFILLEHIESRNPGLKFFEDFGRKLADMHRYYSDGYGFFEDNYIGSTEQRNIPSGDEKDNWVNFYWNKRILFQYKLVEKNGYSTTELRDGIYKIENKINDILSGSKEKPSLLHGDLWGGNYLSDEKGNVCLWIRLFIMVIVKLIWA